MPVSDQWKAREKEADGRAEMNAESSHREAKTPAQTEAQASSTGPLSPGRTKGLAGFWANQTDEVKVSRKKRLEAVETPATETVAENAPQRLDGVVRSEDPGEWQKPVEVEAGRTRNVASAFQQQQATPRHRDVTTDKINVSRRVSDTVTVKKPAQSPTVVLNRSSATVVLAENDPEQLNADVVRSSGGSSWDDVTELEAGRTRNLLLHWKSTEEDAAQPKTSTTRYQGAKPAWLLEIEEARATSSGAIGQSEAWAGNTRQRQQQQQQPDKQVEQQEKRKEKEIEKQTDAAEEKATQQEEQVSSADDEAEGREQAAATEPLLSNEPVTSQRPVSDVIPPPYTHTVQDTPDVSVVMMTGDRQLESPSVSSSPDVSASAPVERAEDFEISRKTETTSDDVVTHQQIVTTERIAVSEAEHHEEQQLEDQQEQQSLQRQQQQQQQLEQRQEQRQHEQQQRVCTELPVTSSPSSSTAATATVARQQTTPPRHATTTTVESADQTRGKRRHRDDKSKTNEQATEQRRCSVM